MKNGCKCKDKQPSTIYKGSRHPSIKDGIGYNRYDGKANGRQMINGVSCVKYNKSVPLNDLLNKVNNVVTPPTLQATNKSDKKKQVEVPKQQVPISRSYASDYMCCWGKDGKIVSMLVHSRRGKS